MAEPIYCGSVIEYHIYVHPFFSRHLQLGVSAFVIALEMFKWNQTTRY